MASKDKTAAELKARIQSLSDENKNLKARIQQLQERVIDTETGPTVSPSTVTSYETKSGGGKKSLTIIVIGASGDLAKKKTFPALFSLYCHKLIPEDVVIAGFARSAMDDATFKAKISQNFKDGFDELKAAFLSRCFYFKGQYVWKEGTHPASESFEAFNDALLEAESKVTEAKGANRIFYLAIPPNVFTDTGKGIAGKAGPQGGAISETGWNRVIVEKPFGRDSESSARLSQDLGLLFREEQIYRIDHYLGKEMVQNLMVLRFANAVFEPLWNRHHIQCVIITFKEPFGTKGRGGYFDKFGIIRDVMQNHLLQILSLIGMEPPVTMSAEDVRDEKVKLLRCIAPLKLALNELVIGQYEADVRDGGTEVGYTEEKDVPDDSVTPTYAAAILHINNYRWKGCPFILKCGKALDQKKAEVRIQFKEPPAELFSDLSPNELVLRVQPDEAVYLKMSMKKPGLQGGIAHSELDLSYAHRFGEGEEKKVDIPEAYERLIYDVVRGDHNLFVRSDELTAAWKIFTPILNELEENHVKPVKYEFGSRGPKEADKMIQEKGGYKRTINYTWGTGAT